MSYATNVITAELSSFVNFSRGLRIYFAGMNPNDMLKIVNQGVHLATFQFSYNKKTIVFSLESMTPGVDPICDHMIKRVEKAEQYIEAVITNNTCPACGGLCPRFQDGFICQNLDTADWELVDDDRDDIEYKSACPRCGIARPADVICDDCWIETNYSECGNGHLVHNMTLELHGCVRCTELEY